MSATLCKTKTNGTSMSPETGRARVHQRSRLGSMQWIRERPRRSRRPGLGYRAKLLTDAEADSIADLYHQEHGFRSQVVMGRHGFGRGEYKYFSYPLPPLIRCVADGGLSHLVPIANQWHERMGKDVRFPADHAAFLDRCHQAGQVRPTPLLLEYAPEDYNCLHRDLYGEHVFPMQIAILLDQPGEDFEGGEFVMTEQRPRMQTRAMVLPLKKGDAAVFAVNSRPMKGVRGDYQVKLNHGVSKLYSGKRHTVGVIFHDAA